MLFEQNSTANGPSTIFWATLAIGKNLVQVIWTRILLGMNLVQDFELDLG